MRVPWIALSSGSSSSRLIHPSAWKQKTGKSACGILHGSTLESPSACAVRLRPRRTSYYML